MCVHDRARPELASDLMGVAAWGDGGAGIPMGSFGDRWEGGHILSRLVPKVRPDRDSASGQSGGGVRSRGASVGACMHALEVGPAREEFVSGCAGPECKTFYSEPLPLLDCCYSKPKTLHFISCSRRYRRNSDGEADIEDEEAEFG
jgi:hypothetical protein